MSSKSLAQNGAPHCTLGWLGLTQRMLKTTPWSASTLTQKTKPPVMLAWYTAGHCYGLTRFDYSLGDIMFLLILRHLQLFLQFDVSWTRSYRNTVENGHFMSISTNTGSIYSHSCSSVVEHCDGGQAGVNIIVHVVSPWYFYLLTQTHDVHYDGVTLL